VLICVYSTFSAFERFSLYTVYNYLQPHVVRSSVEQVFIVLIVVLNIQDFWRITPCVYWQTNVEASSCVVTRPYNCWIMEEAAPKHRKLIQMCMVPFLQTIINCMQRLRITHDAFRHVSLRNTQIFVKLHAQSSHGL
jgi:hypothetical protein